MSIQDGVELARARILVVDDDAFNRTKMSLAVRSLGYRSDSVEDGREALRALETENYDLVLLDIIMPEVDGYEVLTQVKSTPSMRDIPVVVISALDEVEDIVKAIELGAEDHLPKTSNPILLNARIEASLEKKRVRDLEVEYLHQVEKLTSAAAAIEEEGFSPDKLDLNNLSTRSDALGGLVRVFTAMAREVYKREQHLKKQLNSLQIEVDTARQEKQVRSITGTDYFRDLRDKADGLRDMLASNGKGPA